MACERTLIPGNGIIDTVDTADTLLADLTKGVCSFGAKLWIPFFSTPLLLRSSLPFVFLHIIVIVCVFVRKEAVEECLLPHGGEVVSPEESGE
jgi:hypothetical protein